ncbi:hypothetical protein KHQ88_01220 [Mycoplasmatota bacterium]|nr:hypothetical protein KHQ88_01220 [Mycoplasmatota bacterium]
MDKDIIIKYAILIASKDLDIKPTDYMIDQEGVLKGKDLTGLYVPDEHILIFDNDWLETASINDILIVVFHEIRHYYQHIQIDLLYKGINVDINIDVVEKWEKEYEDYKYPYISNQNQYLEQEIEKDAISFSNYLLSRILGLI